MASGTRIPEAELTGIYGAVATRMARKLFGEVPEPWCLDTTYFQAHITSQEFSAACGLEPLAVASTA